MVQSEIAASLVTAASEGHADIIDYLLGEGVPIDAVQGIGYGTALHAACRSGHRDIVEQLLGAGANVNHKGGPDGTALAVAARRADLRLLRRLLDAGADANSNAQWKPTALAAASFGGDLNVVKQLLAAGANVNGKAGKESGDALRYAAYCGRLEIVEHLLAAGANPNIGFSYDGYALQSAVTGPMNNDVRLRIVTRLLQAGADANLLGGTFGSPLVAATQAGNTDIVRVLLKYGADTGTQPLQPSRLSLLHACVHSGKLETLKLLLDAGADCFFESFDILGLTPIHYAVHKKKIDLVRCFLERGGYSETPDYNGHTPLKTAVNACNAEMALLLVPYAKNISSISASDWRRCLTPGHDTDLVVRFGLGWDVSAKQDLKAELAGLCYPIQGIKPMPFLRDFMTKHSEARRL